MNKWDIFGAKRKPRLTNCPGFLAFCPLRDPAKRYAVIFAPQLSTAGIINEIPVKGSAPR